MIPNDNVLREDLCDAILTAQKDPDRNRQPYIDSAKATDPGDDDYINKEMNNARAFVEEEKRAKQEERDDAFVGIVEMVSALPPTPENAEIEAVADALFASGASKARIEEIKTLIVDKTPLGKRDVNALFKASKAKVLETNAVGTMPVSNDLDILYRHGVDCVKAFNGDDPAVFAVDGQPARVDEDQLGEAVVSVMTKDEYFHFVDENTAFVTAKGDNDLVGVAPPEAVMRKMQGSVDEYLPRIEHLTMHPVVTSDLRMLLRSGYDPDTGILVSMADALDGIQVPDIPTDEDVREAVDLIVGEIIADFPLDGKTRDDILADPAGCASLKTVMAMFLQPFLRPAIAGPAPAYLVTKPTQGTGATLLASAAIVAATGAEVNARSFPANNEELQKEILGDLDEKREIIFYDNIKTKIGGGALEGLLTSSGKTGRRLGSNRKIGGEMRAMLILSCNNATVSPDMMRRTAKVVLDARSENPGARDPGSFQHADLLAWSRANRARIVRALLVLCRNWIVTGAERQTMNILASYIDWNGVIGGVLIAAGMGPLVADHEVGRDYVDGTDEQDEEIKLLVERMFALHGCMFVPTIEVGSYSDRDDENSLNGIAVKAGFATIYGDTDNPATAHKLRGRLKNRTFNLPCGTVVRVREDREKGKRGFRLHIVEAAAPQDVAA